jgi:DNA-binding CsgD family transcriptional regulator
MSSLASLTHRDYHRALDFLGEAAAANGSEPFGAATVEHLLDLIPADRTGYYEFETPTSQPDLNIFYAATPAPFPEVAWRSPEVGATSHTWPLLDARTSASRVPLRLSDFLTPARLRRNLWYDTIQRPRNVMFEMKVWLTAPPGVTRGIFFVRTSDRRDFNERDRSILALLRPHLSKIRDRWELRHRPQLLTAREVQVLELVAQGLTNAEIAAALVLSQGTIRAHLEHIFAKLDVHTRTAAAAWLRDLPTPALPRIVTS